MEAWDSDIFVFMPLSKERRSKHNGGTVGGEDTVFFSLLVTPRSYKPKKREKMKNN